MGVVPLALLVAGCPSVPRGFDSPDPNYRLRAIATAGESDVAELIEQLDSGDAAARLLARRKLVDLAGEDFGYHHGDEPWERREAIDRWRAWAVEQGFVQE